MGARPVAFLLIIVEVELRIHRESQTTTVPRLQTWVNDAKVELRGGGVDESPHCYKRLREVLAEHSASVRVLHTLKPLGVAMAGRNEFAPHKD